MNRLPNFRDKLDQVLTTIAILFFAAGVVATFFGVLFRFISFLPSLSWTDEFTEYSMIASVLLITGIGLRRGTQIAFTLILDILSDSLLRVFTIVNGLLMSVFLTIVGYYGFQVALLNQDQLSAVMQIPMIIPYMFIPAGALFMEIEILTMVVTAIRGRDIRPVSRTIAD